MREKTKHTETSPRRERIVLLLIAAVIGMVSPPAILAHEVCDGVDNDGDGLVDEGFDTDGDGVARCCSKKPFFATLSINQQQLAAHHRCCGSSSFTPSVTPIAEVAPGESIRLNGVSDVTGDGALEVVWTKVQTQERKLTYCDGTEWVTKNHGHWDHAYFGGADLNADQVVDFIGWDLSVPLGLTALSFPGPMYAEQIGTYDPSPVSGQWVAARVYNLEDVDSDGQADLVFHSYNSGGSATTDLWLATGAGTGYFNPSSQIFDIINQPQNFGDLGDIDGDHCADWVGGPDDDGDRGAVFAIYGDCGGSFSNQQEVADACDSCPGSGTGHGRGMSQLYDWDCDGELELLTSHVTHTGSTATVTYWDNLGGVFGNQVIVINNAPISTTFASPLRH